MTVLYIICGLVGGFIAVLLINTFRNRPPKGEKPVREALELDSNAIVSHLSGAIKFKTISGQTLEEIDSDIFFGFHEYLEKTYPVLHKTLEKQTINTYSLLYKWPAEKPNEQPLVLMAHMDVVPVDARTAGDWKYPAFSGEIAEGYVWGRGTLDTKNQLICILEAIEYWIKKGFKPERDIYLAFGHDEECTGKLGTEKIVEWFKSKDIRPWIVVDEGGAILSGSSIGIKEHMVLVGICEKGMADVTLEAKAKGGHASQPPKDTAVSDIAKAILLLKKKPMKATMNEPVKEFLDTVSPYMNFPLRLLFSNMWCFKGLILAALSAAPLSNALIRTTFAPTMLAGSTVSNVLPERATATVNFRVSPDDSVGKLTRYIQKTLKKTDVIISEMDAHEPSPVSNTDSDAYRMLKSTIQQVLPDLIVSPYLMIGATDSRMYSDIADYVFRCSPFRSMAEDLDTIHATGERIKIESLIEGVEFFIRLLDNSCRP